MLILNIVLNKIIYKFKYKENKIYINKIDNYVPNVLVILLINIVLKKNYLWIVNKIDKKIRYTSTRLIIK